MAPTPFTVTRSTEIAAPAEAIYPHVVDFHEWTSWSPWETADPDMQRTYDGPVSGVGATYRWSGNRKAGAGTMSITEAVAPRHVTIALNFSRPMKAVNTVLFVLSEDAESQLTTVEWTMTGHSSGFAKVFAFFVPMDKLVGGDFARGLAQLKTHVESSSAA